MKFRLPVVLWIFAMLAIALTWLGNYQSKILRLPIGEWKSAGAVLDDYHSHLIIRSNGTFKQEQSSIEETYTFTGTVVLSSRGTLMFNVASAEKKSATNYTFWSELKTRYPEIIEGHFAIDSTGLLLIEDYSDRENVDKLNFESYHPG